MELISKFCCCGGKYVENGEQLQPLTAFNSPSTINPPVEELIDQTRAIREKVWRSLGTLEPVALSNIDPTGTGPVWPALTQNFRLIKRPTGTYIITSDGLSDPFHDLQHDHNVNGFGLEFFLEVPHQEIGHAPSEIKKSWPFQLLYTISQLAAGHGGIRNIIDDMHLLSTEAEGVQEVIPQDHKRTHVNGAGRVGALLGLSDVPHASGQCIPVTFDDMPFSSVKLINIKLLTLPELKLITDHGAEGRQKLAELFVGEQKMVSSLDRPSVI